MVNRVFDAVPVHYASGAVQATDRPLSASALDRLGWRLMFHKLVDQAANQFPLTWCELQKSVNRQLVMRIDPIFATLLAHFAAHIAVLQLLRLHRQHFGQCAKIRLAGHRPTVEPSGNSLLRHRLTAKAGQQLDEFSRTLTHAGLA